MPSVMADERSEQGDARSDYERPTLSVVGNLKDLLAGSGSKFNDDTLCSAGNGVDPGPC
jgi:hypothetical protein